MRPAAFCTFVSLQCACRFNDLDVPGMSSNYVPYMAAVHAMSLRAPVHNTLRAVSFFWDWLCDRSFVNRTTAGRLMSRHTPHLGSTAAAAALAAVLANTQSLADFGYNEDALRQGGLHSPCCSHPIAHAARLPSVPLYVPCAATSRTRATNAERPAGKHCTCQHRTIAASPPWFW